MHGRKPVSAIHLAQSLRIPTSIMHDFERSYKLQMKFGIN